MINCIVHGLYNLPTIVVSPMLQGVVLDLEQHKQLSQ